MEPRVAIKFQKHRRRQRRQSGYEWYSRLKLFGEVQARGKTVDALTDEEFEHALQSIDRYFKNHDAHHLAWKLKPRRGPQSCAERWDMEKVTYLGEPHRYKFYSRAGRMALALVFLRCPSRPRRHS